MTTNSTQEREAFERAAICILTREFGSVSYEGAESDDEVLQIYEADEGGADELKNFRELASELWQAARATSAPAGDVVERVAEAISAAEERTPGGVSYRDRYDIMARAAIEAMPAGGFHLSAIETLKAASAAIPAPSVVGEDEVVEIMAIAWVNKRRQRFGLGPTSLQLIEMNDGQVETEHMLEAIRASYRALIAAGVINGGGERG